MPSAHFAYSTARFFAVLGSVVVWLFGSLACLYFLGWAISSPDGDPAPETSPAAVVVLAVVALADVLLCVAASRPAGAKVLRVSVISVVVLALVGLVGRAQDTSGIPPAPFVVLAFLVPALACALVLPAAILGRRDLRAAARSMRGIAVIFLTALAVLEVSGAQMWIGTADLLGALATGVLALLFRGAGAARERVTAGAAQPLETASSESGPSAV